jgi:uncharacterized protein YutE (UPF0331/DUF86 family)
MRLERRDFENAATGKYFDFVQYYKRVVERRLANKRMLEYTSKLENLNECLRKLYSIAKKYTTLTFYKKANWMVKDAVERNIQKSIEIIIDMGKMLIPDRHPTPLKKYFP